MKRYVAIAEYQRKTGLSYPTIKNALESGQLIGIKTEAGHWKVDLVTDGNADLMSVHGKLDGLERQIKALIEHLGVRRT